MSTVADLLRDLTGSDASDSPEIRLHSPTVRPAETRASPAFSPNSPFSPRCIVEGAETQPDGLVSSTRERAVLAFLDENPHTKRAIVIDLDTDPAHVIVTIGIRSKAIGEVLIPRERYDASELFRLFDKSYGANGSDPLYPHDGGDVMSDSLPGQSVAKRSQIQHHRTHFMAESERNDKEVAAATGRLVKDLLTTAR